MQEINVKLDVFEGPLDLLLHLIQKLEIDIYDIPIAAVTEQYMNYIHTMKTLALEVAGEYIVMAATLMAIKSQMLLPIEEVPLYEDEEMTTGEDPREALVQQLLEYRKFKYAAQVLQEKEADRSLYFTKEPMDLADFCEEEPALPPEQVSTIDLFLAFHNMLEKRKKRQPIETTVATESISMEEKITWIRQKMTQLTLTEEISFESLLQEESKQELVTTFMALLEVMKSGLIMVSQTDNCGEILIQKRREPMEEER